MIQSRRSFLKGVLALPLVVPDRLAWALPTNTESVVSPNGTIRFELVHEKNSPVKYQVKFRNRPVI